MTGARYAALGVINESGTGLERFLHTGVDADTVAAIGHLPRGLGILGALLTDARSLRLESIARRSTLGGIPTEPSADARLPRRTDPLARSGVREPLPDGEEVRLVHRGGSGARRDSRQPGRRRDRERPPLRSRDELVGAAGGAERSRNGARKRDRARAAAGVDRPPAAWLDRRAARDDRTSGDRRNLAHRSGRRRRGRTRSSACSSSERARRADACSNAVAPSVSMRLATIRRSTRTRSSGSAPGPASSFRSLSDGGRSASSSPTTSNVRIPGSATRICVWPRPSPHVPRSPSTSPRAWRAMRSVGSWRRRSWSDAGSRASCTIRRVRS